jgi:23S rRNA pseudouridine1911/1915/1917 synthase
VRFVCTRDPRHAADMAYRVTTAGRLVDLVKQHLAVVAIDRIGPLIADGAVTVDGRIGKINDQVAAGAELAVTTVQDALVPEDVQLAIEFEDDDLVIVDKPAAIHVHPLGEYRRGTLLNALLWHAGARPDQPWAAWRPRPAHRLDRGASGLVAIAKHAAVHDRLRGQLEDHSMYRLYRATVHGQVASDAGTIDQPLGRDPTNDYRRAIVVGGQPAITRYRVIERTPTHTVVELELATGRTHQIRAHLASLGHPIVGDVLYGAALGTTDTIELRAIGLQLNHRDRRLCCTA